MSNQTTEEILTNKEKRSAVYQEDIAPTYPEDVTRITPLEELNLNWTEKQLPEKIRTKHVHRLHPYLGKYIPQLVEIFLRKYFEPGDTVLDPFAGSGTTLVQANELGINSVGSDVSVFNIIIGKVKTGQYNLSKLKEETADILEKTAHLTNNAGGSFPLNGIPNINPITDNPYLMDWFASKALSELLIFRELIPNYEHQDFLKLVLSRSARSARLTTHFDLDFPKKPVTEPYDCYKHSRICSPTKESFKFLKRYCIDGIKRIEEFAQLRTNASIQFIHGDSRTVKFPEIDGVITSPPYVGLIDYHEQHRYAFELFGLEDNREQEIGAAKKGQSKAAKENYKEGIAQVFKNAMKRIRKGGRMIVVAGDRSNLYPEIAEMAGVSLETTIQRHVNRRTGRRSGDFFETIFIYQKD